MKFDNRESINNIYIIANQYHIVMRTEAEIRAEMRQLSIDMTRTKSEMMSIAAEACMATLAWVISRDKYELVGDP